MATIPRELHPGQADFLTSAYPEFKRIYGSNHPVSVLGFSASSTESAYWLLRSFGYVAGNVTVDVDYYADTATTGETVWDASLAVITPNADTQNVETNSFATANTTTAAVGSNTQQLHRATVTISNLDSLTGEDAVWLKLSRDTGDSADTMSGDALVTLVGFSYDN